MEDTFNEFHLDHFKNYAFGIRRLRDVYGAPRGSAKSTLVSLIDPIHDLCYGTEKYIVLFSNTGPQADEKLSNIRTELLLNERLRHIYGIRFPSKTPPKTGFVAISNRGEIKFEGYGAGAEVRGLLFGPFRPTKLLFDDLEHSDETDSEALREKLLKKYQDVWMKLGSKRLTNIVFVGTVLHKKSLLKNLLANPLYRAKLYKSIISWSEREDLWEKWRDIIRSNPSQELRSDALTQAKKFFEENKSEMLKGTRVLWPERESYYDLMLELLETGRRSFMKEKQNDPMGDEEKLFDFEHILWYRDEVRDGVRGFFVERTGAFIPRDGMLTYGVIDPAHGQTKATIKKKSDFACILSGFHDPDSKRLFCHHAWIKRTPPSKQIEAMFELHNEFNYAKFGVETNLFRELLMENISRVQKQILSLKPRSPRLKLYDIEQTENKIKRIHSVEPKVFSGYILLNRALHQEFLDQLEGFPKEDHDDGPDALEMLYGLVNNRYKMSAINLDTQGSV